MKNEFKRRSVKTPTEVRYSIKREHSFKDGVLFRKSRHIDDFFIVSQISKKKKSDFFKELYDCEEQDKFPSFNTRDEEEIYLKNQDSHIKDFIKKQIHDLKDAKELHHKPKNKRLCSHSELNRKFSNSQCGLLEHKHIYSPKKRLRKNSFDHYFNKYTKEIKHKKKRNNDNEKELMSVNYKDHHSKDINDPKKKIYLKTSSSNNEKQKKKINNHEEMTVITPNFKTVESSKNLKRHCHLLKNEVTFLSDMKDEYSVIRDNESSSYIANLDNSSQVNK